MKRFYLALFVALCPSLAAAQALHDIVEKGSTDRSVTIYIMDSSDGTPETGVEHNTSGIALWYRRESAAQSAITEVALAALTTAHTDGGIEHIGDGYYRVDLPDAAFATGANHVDFGGAVTGMIVKGGRVRLVDWDLETALESGADIADAVWDEDMTAHQTQGTAGQTIGDPGSDSDTIWALANTNLDATVSSRSSFDQSTDTVITLGMTQGTADSGSTTTFVDAALTQGDDYWNGQWVVFTSGNASGQARLITDFVASTDTVTFTPAADGAISTDTYVILPSNTIAWNAAWDAEVESEVDDSIGGGTGTALTGVPWTSWTATVDGETLSDIMHYLGAVFMGDRTIVDNGATQTTTYDGMDGTAGRVISTTNETTKARTIDTLNGTP